MKSFVYVIVVVVGLLALPASRAGASCVESTVGERAARAEVIASGTVTETRQTFAPASGVIRFDAQQILKGTIAPNVEVYLGPTRGGAVTSVDYTVVKRGEVHTLYLRAAGNSVYETDDCSGSHAGGPTPEEIRVLGEGRFQTVYRDGGTDWLLPGALAIVLAASAGIALLLARRRRAA